MRTKTYLIVSSLVLASLLTGCAGAAFAQTETPAGQGDEAKVTRTVTVTGSGKVYLTPDIAYITIGVHTEGENAAEAVAANNAQAQEVIDALLAQGIAERDIQTTNFSIYPQQEFDSEGKPTGTIKYIVDNSVFVTVRDITNVGDVLDAAVKAGANSISGIQFDVADKTAALSEARQAAVADAGVKAEELASAAGVTLGDVQTISEYTTGGPQPMYDMRAAAPMAEAASVPIQTGQMLLTVEVNMVYEIR
jgi:uncharacterized protein YggE